MTIVRGFCIEEIVALDSENKKLSEKETEEQKTPRAKIPDK
jgi:hypothetical protein